MSAHTLSHLAHIHICITAQMRTLSHILTQTNKHASDTRNSSSIIYHSRMAPILQKLTHKYTRSTHHARHRYNSSHLHAIQLSRFRVASCRNVISLAQIIHLFKSPIMVYEFAPPIRRPARTLVTTFLLVVCCS